MVLNSWQKFLKKHKGLGLKPDELQDLYYNKKLYQIGGMDMLPRRLPPPPPRAPPQVPQNWMQHAQRARDQQGHTIYILPKNTPLYRGHEECRPEKAQQLAAEFLYRPFIWLSDPTTADIYTGRNPRQRTHSCCAYGIKQELALLAMDDIRNIQFLAEQCTRMIAEAEQVLNMTPKQRKKFKGKLPPPATAQYQKDTFTLYYNALEQTFPIRGGELQRYSSYKHDKLAAELVCQLGYQGWAHGPMLKGMGKLTHEAEVMVCQPAKYLSFLGIKPCQ